MNMGISALVLEWSIALTGLLALLLSSWAFYDALTKRRAIIVAHLNGGLAALVFQHVILSSTSALASLMSALGGLWLVTLPNSHTASEILAEHEWLFFNTLLVVHLSVEHWAKSQVDTKIKVVKQIVVQVGDPHDD